MSDKKYTAQEMRQRADEEERHWNDHVTAAMLRQAAEMRERCEKMIRPCNLEDCPCVPSDDGYCDTCDVPKHNEPFNYILRGDEGKEER